MLQPTETAVVIPVGAAQDVVAGYRRELDLAATWGVPAQVTVLYPFVPPSDLSVDVLQRLGAAVRSVEPFTCAFTRHTWAGDEALWLLPEPDQPFRDLTAAVTREFPDRTPYGRALDDAVPHLTVGVRRGGATSGPGGAAGVEGRLPFSADVDHALLVAGTGESWHTLVRLPLGAGAA